VRRRSLGGCDVGRRNPCYVLGIMLNDLITAFLVAFAAVPASDLLKRNLGIFLSP
jgi:hypothetical protein